MKLDIIDLLLGGAALTVPIIGQAVAATPESSLVGLISNITGFSFAVLLVLYNKFYELPRWERERRDERAEMLNAFKSERLEIIQTFRVQMDEKRKDYLSDVAQARQEFLAQLTEERASFEQMLARMTKEPK